jgi:hypothetical protein
MPKFLYELRHTSRAAQGGTSVENKALPPLVVYLRLRIVTITLTSKVLDVVGGGVSDLPSVGMLPAKIEVDSAHMSASAIANRFI